MHIYHGDNQVLSRQQFIHAKTQSRSQEKNVLEYSGADVTLPQIEAAISTVSLFGQAPAIFIELLFSRRPSNTKDLLVSYLQNHTQADIYIWENKDVTTQLKGFPPAVVHNYPLPKYLFEFLDTLSISSFHKTIAVAPIEQVFASLVTRMYKNLQANPSAANSARISSLLEIDFAQKTSQSACNLQTALELWVTSL